MRPKRKYRKCTNLALSQRKHRHLPAPDIPTVEYKSPRDLRAEKRRQTEQCGTHSFNIVEGPSQKKGKLEAQPSVNSPLLSADDAETDYFSEGDVSSTPANYVQRCIRDIPNSDLWKTVLRKCEEKGLTRHFMALMQHIASGQIPVTNMSFLLCLEVGLLHSLDNATQMRYRNDTSMFWELVLSIGGPRLLRLFSSDKHFGQVNSGECKKSKYPPSQGNYNFAVPDEQTLRKSKTEIPKDVPCGIIEESLFLLDANKEYILSLDGKQAGQGLREDGVGDVNLWGFEGPPSLRDTLRFFRNETNNILLIADKVYDQEDDTVIDDDVVKQFKFVVEALSLRIKALREAKVRHEMLRSTFTKKVTKFPDMGSRYKIAFAEIEAFIAKADMVINEILQLNVRWCLLMAKINKMSKCIVTRGTVDLEKQGNLRLLLNPDVIERLIPGFIEDYPVYVKQRTPEWFAVRRHSRITASTMHNALGLRTLKAQKEHFDEFVTGKIIPRIETPPAMAHGTKHEVTL